MAPELFFNYFYFLKLFFYTLLQSFFFSYQLNYKYFTVFKQTLHHIKALLFKNTKYWQLKPAFKILPEVNVFYINFFFFLVFSQFFFFIKFFYLLKQPHLYKVFFLFKKNFLLSFYYLCIKKQFLILESKIIFLWITLISFFTMRFGEIC